MKVTVLEAVCVPIGHGKYSSHIPELDVTSVSRIRQLKGFTKEGRTLPWWTLLKECVVVYGRE